MSSSIHLKWILQFLKFHDILNNKSIFNGSNFFQREIFIENEMKWNPPSAYQDIEVNSIQHSIQSQKSMKLNFYTTFRTFYLSWIWTSNLLIFEKISIYPFFIYFSIKWSLKFFFLDEINPRKDRCETLSLIRRISNISMKSIKRRKVFGSKIESFVFPSNYSTNSWVEFELIANCSRVSIKILPPFDTRISFNLSRDHSKLSKIDDIKEIEKEKESFSMSKKKYLSSIEKEKLKTFPTSSWSTWGRRKKKEFLNFNWRAKI